MRYIINQFFGLHKHTAGTAARIENPTFVRFEHLYKQFNNAARGIELSALFTFGQGKLAQKIFEHMPQHIGTSGLGITKGYIAH